MALTTFLENLISQGKAKYETFVVGASGTANIPVPDNSFIIITDFDYWYFVDEPVPTPAQPAIAVMAIRNEDPAAPFNIQGLNISGIPLVSPDVAFDPADVVTSEANLQAWLDTFFLGFLCTVQFAAGAWKVTFESTPGTTYNGQIVDGGVSVPGPGITPGTFAGGADAAAVTVDDYLTRRTHQLTFRSQNASNHFQINEKIDVHFYAADTEDFYVNVNGFYHKDCYLMHKYDVRVNIHRVPQSEEWSTVYGALDSKSNEPNQPQGYGQLGGGLPVVQEVLFDAAVEQYLPLGQKYSTQTLQQYTPQFDTKCATGRELQDPTNVSGVRGVRRNFPLINIGYVLITGGNYTQYFVNG